MLQFASDFYSFLHNQPLIASTQESVPHHDQRVHASVSRVVLESDASRLSPYQGHDDGNFFGNTEEEVLNQQHVLRSLLYNYDAPVSGSLTKLSVIEASKYNLNKIPRIIHQVRTTSCCCCCCCCCS